MVQYSSQLRLFGQSILFAPIRVYTDTYRNRVRSDYVSCSRHHLMDHFPPTYLTQRCLRCNGYLGIVLREAGRNTPLRAINGRCVQCGRRLA